MPTRKKAGARLLGPYEHHGGYRYISVAVDGSKTPSETFASRQACERAKLEEQATLDGRSDVSVTESLDAYEIFLREEGHSRGPCKQQSIYQTRRRIESLLPDGEMLVEALTEQYCQTAYDSLRTRATDASRLRCELAEKHTPGDMGCTRCRLYSAAWHRNALAQAKTWGRWMVKPQRYIPVSPFEDIKGKGKVAKGKAQLSIDEARQFMLTAHPLAAGDPMDEGAVAALMALEMGLRDNEIIKRLARQLDDRCRRLIIVDGKNDESNQTVPIPEDLQPYMERLKAGKFPLQSIWTGYRGKPHRKGWVQDQVARICRLAGVPVVTAHGLRGTYSSLKIAGGWRELTDSVRKGLRHTKFSTSASHYVDGDASRAAGQVAALSVLMDEGEEEPREP